jgi:hypothetical protein
VRGGDRGRADRRCCGYIPVAHAAGLIWSEDKPDQSCGLQAAGSGGELEVGGGKASGQRQGSRSVGLTHPPDQSASHRPHRTRSRNTALLSRRPIPGSPPAHGTSGRRSPPTRAPTRFS